MTFSHQPSLFSDFAEIDEQLLNDDEQQIYESNTKPKRQEGFTLPPDAHETKIGHPVGSPSSSHTLVIATDGACSGNPGPGGWAFVDQTSGYAVSGGSGQTTNNIMELTAMLHALRYAGPDVDLLLRVDSKYVIDSMTKWAAGWRNRGWRKADGKPVLNRELIEEILNLYEARTGRTDIEWVRGHNGDPGNDLADRLAVEQTALHK
ncbi:ribonuclease H family protein [Arcanobacterium pinnipediorum]|uniref:Ribonuclease H n=1 Tax=Arcanobacterium pinnipediorum TaxID=1503041 RepID=A0ABY5AHK8_9ACTO|nr:ribonuclease H [Arcanobacterium pinnipediorum]USR79491.1 ribonuclease HI [Arcanobacterium pinnipediorum]